MTISWEPRQRVLLHTFPTFAVGGSQIRFAAIANHFGARYRHLVVALDGVTSCADRLAADVPVDLLSLPLAKGSTFANGWSLRRHLRRLRPDVLVTYNWGAIEWALANLMPLCRHIHIEDGFGPDEAGGQLRRRMLFRRLVLTPWSQVVLPSRQLYGIAADLWRLPPRKLHYLPNGIDCDRFAAPVDEQRLAELRGEAGNLLIGTVAALRPEKNIARLVRAFARIHRSLPVRLAIVGDGPEREPLRKLAAELGVAGQVHFTGAIRAPETVLGGFDLFALSSDTEQMPYGILEAMAAGLPIAAVDVGDVRQMVSPDNRGAVVEKSEEALAAAMLNLLRDPAARRRLGAANVTHVRSHYGQDAMFRRYAALFDGEVEGAAPSPLVGEGRGEGAGARQRA